MFSAVQVPKRITVYYQQDATILVGFRRWPERIAPKYQAWMDVISAFVVCVEERGLEVKLNEFRRAQII